MRRFLALLVFPILIVPALAAHPPTGDAHRAHRPRQTWEQHFARANLGHDGHLTLNEANGGYPLIAKNFAAMDAQHKGYVTEADVRAWRVRRKAEHHPAHRRTSKRKARHVAMGPSSEQHPMSPAPEAAQPGSAQGK